MTSDRERKEMSRAFDHEQARLEQSPAWKQHVNREEALRLIRRGIDAEPFMLGTHTAAHDALLALAADLEAAREALAATYQDEDYVHVTEYLAEKRRAEAAERERDEAKSEVERLLPFEAEAVQLSIDLATAREALRDYERGRDAGSMDRLRDVLRSLEEEA